MRKSNKGFTLVELLAAIVILGILIGVTIPIIVSLLDTSRSKMYINDAKKLVTQAEYKLKSNSSLIEKPDEGDCIIISMVYLDSSDFDNPPNDGTYVKESSYVVVKNNGGKLEYSVSIVERLKKGGYKGVELVKSDTLLSNSAIKHVVNFKASDLVNVETDLNRGYINEKLGSDYISSENRISAIYNTSDLANGDDFSSGVAGIPRITSATLMSTSNKEYNSLDVTLQLRVADRDTKKSYLSVFIGINSSYDAALDGDGIPYGNNDDFSYNIDLSNSYTYNGDSIKIYIVVQDPEGNMARKTMTYTIHSNTAPEISDTSTISKRASDSVNMTTALLELDVSDDIDAPSSFFVCFKESSSNEDFTVCNDYQPYTSYFSNENTMEYTFNNCTGGCKRDGSTHYLTVFIKDSFGKITKKKFDYKFSVNENPQISSFEIKSQTEEFTTNSSKTMVITVDALDDVTNADQLQVRVNDGIGSNTYNYSNQPIYHTINSLYDGSTKNITIEVIDSEGGIGSVHKNYTLYKNQKPKVNSFEVLSNGVACNDPLVCPVEKGGSLNTNISLNVVDDIDYQNNYSDLLVCISLSDNVCNDYKSYSYYYNKEYPYQLNGVYDGSTKKVYAYIKDTYGEITKVSYDYKLYEEKEPVIGFATFSSIENSKPETNNLNTIFRINAYDDFSDVSQLKLSIVEDGVTKINNVNLSNYINQDNNYLLSGGYDGNTRNLLVKVTDTKGLTATKEVNYVVYNDKKPTIDYFDVYSKTIPCKDEEYCPLENNGNYNAYYKLKVHDDIDVDENIQICISPIDSCNTYTSYSNYYDNIGNALEFNYVFSVNDNTKPYDGSEKHLYLFVKDSANNITKKDYVYKLYDNKAPIIIGNPSLTTNSSDLDVNIPDAVYSISATDDLDDVFSISYCYKKDGGNEVCTNYQNYQESKVLDNTFFNVDHPNGQEYKVYVKLKDSYGKVTTSDKITYRLYSDISPLIYSKDIASGRVVYKTSDGEVHDSVPVGEYTTYTRLKINFSVDDPYDKYTVCVSENSNTCTNYKGLFDGNICDNSNCSNLRKINSVYYDKLGTISDGDNLDLYLFVKDNYGNIVKTSIYNKTYNLCNDYDSEDAYYEYVFDSVTTGSDDPISIDRCQGLCYAYNSSTSETNNIVAYYTAKISYTDKINSNIACNNGEPISISHRASCDFKDCFYKNNNYTRKAIGTRLIHDSELWTVNVNGNDYVCDSHYYLYLSSYNNGDEGISLTKTNTMICKQAFDNHEYDYDSNSNDPYVRIDD